MNLHARNLSVTLMAAVSGIALSVCLSPAFAQAYDSPERNRVNADGMPTTHSTAAEKADTARINRQVGADNRAVDDRVGGDNARYQSEQNKYQSEQNKYQADVQDNRVKQAEYDAKNARYNELRNRYAAERAAYHRGTWSRDGRWSVMDRDANLIGGRVQLMNGRTVGTVTDTSRGRGGSVTALLVRLDNNRTVWIDASDVRYNRADRVIMTNLDRGDLRRMADQRL